ncbi:hypothetical protein PMAYCL1PPCAC_18376 [Pristionchus mayeri]|uniref:Prefoldin subunit 1 n=1 Tax=Pristionchus mayeri TaxID=1317129 RepID=A0AAN5I1Z4_9BILA|nr:hypothetical protein PMAYCL1PPCAC_18376 [Pristionchus mayeri]
MAGDEELRQAFRELATKVTEAKQRIAQGEVKKQSALRNEKSSRLAASQLKELGDRPTYHGVGRMFILTSSTAEIERHIKEADDFKQSAVAVDKQREFLEKSVEESERNLREMVSQKRSSDS